MPGVQLSFPPSLRPSPPKTVSTMWRNPSQESFTLEKSQKQPQCRQNMLYVPNETATRRNVTQPLKVKGAACDDGCGNTRLSYWCRKAPGLRARQQNRLQSPGKGPRFWLIYVNCMCVMCKGVIEKIPNEQMVRLIIAICGWCSSTIFSFLFVFVCNFFLQWTRYHFYKNKGMFLEEVKDARTPHFKI